MLPITACMIAKNEAKNLPSALDSLRGVVEAIIVGDTGSTDATREIAATFGAIVIEVPWTNDFAAARNMTLNEAKTPWILVLDADEMLDTPLELQQAITSATDGVEVTIRNLTPPEDAIAWEDFPLVRLFRNRPSIRYEGRIHEQVRSSILRAGGKISTSEVIFRHTGYANPRLADGRLRADRNREVLEQAVIENPMDTWLLYHLGKTRKALGDFSGAKSAFIQAERDHGLGKVIQRDLTVGLAQIALAEEDYITCERYARRALQLAPKDAVALQNLVVALMTTGRFAEAMDPLQLAIAHPAIREEVRTEFIRLRTLIGG